MSCIDSGFMYAVTVSLLHVMRIIFLFTQEQIRNRSNQPNQSNQLREISKEPLS